MKIREDIHVGRATVKAAENGGWALPGGRITGNQIEAMRVAVELDSLIGEDAFVEDNRKMLQAIRKQNINAKPPIGL